MKKVGILGITYEATAIFYRGLCDRAQSVLGAHSNPDILLHCPTFDLFLVEESERNEVWTHLMVESISRLTMAGCDFIVCPANSNHVVFDTVIKQIDIPWISIIDSVKSELQKQKITSCGLLATNFTVNSGIYKSADRKIISPEQKMQENLHNEIMKYLVFGEIRPEGSILIKKLIAEFCDAQFDGVILGCTELTMFVEELEKFLKAEGRKLKIFDSTTLLIERTLQEVLSN